MEKKIPKCIGIIMDGNRRWAREKNFPTLEGHRQGANRLIDTVHWVRDRGIKHLIVFAFSTENWDRSQEEVSNLMDLAMYAMKEIFPKIVEEGIRIKVVGERERFEKKLQDAMSHVEKTSESNDALTLWVCISYGGRVEILEAAKKAAKEGEITEETLNKHLWTSGMPDPDIIIRTGGVHRLSGFLTWQSVYSELFFIEEKWPDFSEQILDSVLAEFARRERRMGK